MFSKIHVTGASASTIWKYLEFYIKFEYDDVKVKKGDWNWTKVLID